jgi:hypothetical protein
VSSTNRGADRHAADYYITPQQPIADFLSAYLEDAEELGLPIPRVVLDPCAGGDAEHPMAYPTALRAHPVFLSIDTPIVTLDYRADSPCDYPGTDFLTWVAPTGHNQPEMVITNPPFIIAQDIINRALAVVRPGGAVVMLLRLNYFGTEKRKAWWQANMPVATYIHSKRIGFTPDGKTDSVEYMHAVWVKGRSPKHTALRVI